MKEIRIEDFPIPQKTIKFLKHNNIHLVQELLEKAEEDFMRMQMTNESGKKLRHLGRKELCILLLAIEEVRNIHR